MPRHRRHSIEFKRQVVTEYLGGESLNALCKRHDLSRFLIRVWVEKAEGGQLDQDVAAADLLGAYEAKIAALERLVGQQTLEITFLKKAQRPVPSAKSAPSCAPADPTVSASNGGAR